MALSSVKIKMQNLKEELDAANHRLEGKSRDLEVEKILREEKEKELFVKLCQLQKLESSLDESQLKIQDANSQLLQLTAVTDEYNRMHRASECRQKADEGRRDGLEAALAQSLHDTQMAQDKYQEVAIKLLLREKILSEAEEKAYDAERKTKGLETELHVLTTSLKSLKVHETKTSQKSSIYETTISTLTEKINQVEEANKSAEYKVINMQKQVDNLEEELSAVKDEGKKLKEEFEAAYRELHSI